MQRNKLCPSLCGMRCAHHIGVIQAHIGQAIDAKERGICTIGVDQINIVIGLLILLSLVLYKLVFQHNQTLQLAQL